MGELSTGGGKKLHGVNLGQYAAGRPPGMKPPKAGKPRVPRARPVKQPTVPFQRKR